MGSTKRRYKKSPTIYFLNYFLGAIFQIKIDEKHYPSHHFEWQIPSRKCFATTNSNTRGVPIEFKCVQFPIRLAFAMTINKSQGQTMSVCGLDLGTPCFSHGQLLICQSFHLCQNDCLPFWRRTQGESTVGLVN